jgi:long-subunit fatty acid transport protein
MIINDFHFEAGLQYHHTFTNNLFLNAGLVYQVPFNMTGRKTYLVERFVSSSSAETTRDTIVYIHNEHGKIHMPGGLGGGVIVGTKDFWMVGADVSWQNWDNYTTFGVKDSLKSSLDMNVGFQIVPKHTSVSNYFKKVTYRVGGRYNNTYLNLHTNPVNEYAVSVGLGFPFRKTGSAINLSVEFGQRGTTKDNLIKETFVRGIVGLSLKEFWFFRRKLD